MVHRGESVKTLISQLLVLFNKKKKKICKGEICVYAYANLLRYNRKIEKFLK